MRILCDHTCQNAPACGGQGSWDRIVFLTPREAHRVRFGNGGRVGDRLADYNWVSPYEVTYHSLSSYVTLYICLHAALRVISSPHSRQRYFVNDCPPNENFSMSKSLLLWQIGHTTLCWELNVSHWWRLILTRCIPTLTDRERWTLTHKVVYSFRCDYQSSVHSLSIAGNSAFYQPITRTVRIRI
jgi:hypothetical protein